MEDQLIKELLRDEPGFMTWPQFDYEGAREARAEYERESREQRGERFDYLVGEA